MDHLHFSARARRRARRRRRLRRLQAAIVVAGAIAAIFDLPGSLTGFDLLEHLAARHGLHPVSSNGLESSEAAASEMRFRRSLFDARPAPTPSPDEEPREESEEEPQAPAYSGSVTEIVHAAGAEFGVSGDYLVSVAYCESRLDPNAHNLAGYHGLFQFDLQTWGAYGYGSIWDPVAQARTAARLIAAGQTSRWPNCA